MNVARPALRNSDAAPATTLEDALATVASEAALHDHNGADPSALVRPLIEANLFTSVLPEPFGFGLATNPSKALNLHDLLRRVGGANLSAGRLFEGHTNAVKLVFDFGTEQQKAEVTAGVGGGDLMGVWNAEAPPGVRLAIAADGHVLRGAKIYASGVGLLHRPLITARDAEGGLHITAPKAVNRAPYDLSGWRMRGMRATATGTIHLDGVRVEDDEIIGSPGDYYRSPGFRGGAWRFATVQFGALETIARLIRLGLKARGREADPHQKARLGQAEIAVQTARLWTRHAAEVVEGSSASPDDADACAGMARLVVERASLDVIRAGRTGAGADGFRRSRADRADHPRPSDLSAPAFSRRGARRCRHVGVRALSGKATLGPDYFDALYAADPDPWKFETSPYEDAKYAATIAALGGRGFDRVLEVGCSIGVLTGRLAALTPSLIATDISSRALETAKARNAALSNVSFAERGLPSDLPAGPFDLIVLSEVLYYLSPQDLAVGVDAVLDRLAPDGEALLVHWLGETGYSPHRPRGGGRVHRAGWASDDHSPAEPDRALSSGSSAPNGLSRVRSWPARAISRGS